MLTEILQLNLLLADCLKETQRLKSYAVSLQHYEYAAKIRDFEKQFEVIKENLSGLSYPIIPTRGLTRNGQIYSSQLFRYGQACGWKMLPDHINELFKTRKAELNQVMEFTDSATEYFVQLNSKLTTEEKRIELFINSLYTIYGANNLETIIDDFSYGGIVLQFLTSKEFTRSFDKNVSAKWSFYEMEISIDDWVAENQRYYANPNNSEDAFLDVLPVALRSEKICYLFYYLGSYGFLALQDMINIAQIQLNFPFLCRLKRI